MADYDYALGFEAFTGSTDQLTLPPDPLPPAPDASEEEQVRYSQALAEHAEAKRRYEAGLYALTQDSEHWTEQRSPLGSDEQAARDVVNEFAMLHDSNPLVRNPGLYRAPAIVWERVADPQPVEQPAAWQPEEQPAQPADPAVAE